ncbi:MAG: hypothetical protein GY830_05840 [Bacteroidetes bacterium]|nr:hypothetical protein [Bacteroidota bacterium]
MHKAFLNIAIIIIIIINCKSPTNYNANTHCNNKFHKEEKLNTKFNLRSIKSNRFCFYKSAKYYTISLILISFLYVIINHSLNFEECCYHKFGEFQQLDAIKSKSYNYDTSKIYTNYTSNKLLKIKRNSDNISSLNPTKKVNQTNSTFDFLIFQIGFQKCGTAALFNIFEKNNISSIHYMIGKKRKGKPLRTFMFENYLNNELILGDLTDKTRFYSDFKIYIDPILYDTSLKFLNDEYKFGSYRTWYEVLIEQYPTSKYILNIRPVNNWLKSRHTFLYPYIKKESLAYFFKNSLNSIYQDDLDVVIGSKEIWYKYICELIYYFKKKNLLNDLLIFDIEDDHINKLIDFFEKFNLVLNGSYYYNNHKTGLNKKNKVKFKEWDSIVKQYPEFAKKENYSEWRQIKKICKLNI